MVHKALERFLSVENPISRPVFKKFSSLFAYLEFRGRKLFMKIITSKIMIPTEIPRVCRQGLLDILREDADGNKRYARLITVRDLSDAEPIVAKAKRAIRT
jgi:hypothetical protein